jgi:hypothetical protein
MTLPIVPSPRLPKQTLINIVKVCSGVGVVWGTARRPHMGQTAGKENAWIRLSILSYNRVGVDELRTQFDPVNNVTDCILVGQRQFTLNITARSMDPTLEAFDLCERVAYRLRTSTARDLFGDLLSLRDIQPIQVLNDEAADDRIVLAASMDVRWNSTVYTDPNEAGEGQFAESAKQTGQLLE